MPDLVEKLDLPEYRSRVKVRGYRDAITIFQACTACDLGRVARRINPSWSKLDHLDLARRHKETAEEQWSHYGRLLDEAAHATFGRPFEFFDYQISGIGCEEFTEEHKKALRFAVHSANNHRQLAQAHGHAARYMRPVAVEPDPRRN